MKPLNKDEPGCNYTSSNCVIWQGPDIPCIKLCKGDSISEVVDKLAKELCDVLVILDVSTYDLSCLNLQCAPKDFHEFLQVLINTICNLQAGSPPAAQPSQSVNDTIIPVAPCFYYTNSFGDQVTTMTVTEYVTAIGNRICGLETRVTAVEQATAVQSTQISVLQSEVAAIPTVTTTPIIPVCVLPAVPTDPDIVLQALETQFCELLGATGTPTEIYEAIVKQCVGLAAQETLGGGGGNMASIPGWNNALNNMAAAIGNIWLTLCDMRAAIVNIKLNCCPSGCDGITLSFTAVLTGTNLVIYLNGTIPSGFANCLPAGSQVIITDDNGGSFTTNIDMIFFINNPSGFTISLLSTPINTSSNLHIKINSCLTNPSTLATCEACLEYLLVNQANCPVIIYSPTADSVAYSGTSVAGTNTYKVQLWDNTGTTLLFQQTQVVTFPALVAGTFSGLVINSLFKARVIVTNASMVDTICPFTPVALLPTVLLPVALGAANSFAVLGDGGITDVGAACTIIGDVGSDPTVTIVGIVALDVTGILYTIADPAVINAQIALTNAIADASTRVPVVTIPDSLDGVTINPGYYDTTTGTITLSAGLNVTFDGGGDPNAVFIIQVATTFTVGAASTMTLVNGANFNNIFWQVDTITTIAAAAIVKGNFLGTGNIVVGTAADVQGRLMTSGGAVTLDTNPIYNI